MANTRYKFPKIIIKMKFYEVKNVIKLEKTDTYGWESAIRGMRNPMNSWDKSDSGYIAPRGGVHLPIIYNIGENDLKLMKNLSKAGSDHGKFLRMINVTVDITAPLYWWKEFDTYKVGTVANSCSTMHKIHEKKFEKGDFSCEHLINEPLITQEDGTVTQYNLQADSFLDILISILNVSREMFLKTKDKKYWWQMIQLLPSSYNQKRTVQLNYQVLKNMYFARRLHKLDEWRTFCEWIESLPYAKELITMDTDKEKNNE